VSTFTALTLAESLEVVRGMREWDRRAVRALLGDIGEEDFAASRWSTDGPAWTAHQAGEKVAIGGLQFVNAWIGVFWFLATDRIAGQTWGKLLRHTRTVIANASNPAHEHYRHRIEAYTLGGWGGAERLVERLGFVREGVRRGAGSGGEDINTWAITGPAKGAR
jgi:hypothetical protein